MNKRFGSFILVGLLFGAIFGLWNVPATGNVPLSMGMGALAGLFAGWFAAVAAEQYRKEQ
jgi:ABC-type uncharacterized transport system permease subunit